jgi:hypothetical protein
MRCLGWWWGLLAFAILGLVGCGVVPLVFAAREFTVDVSVDGTPGSGITGREFDQTLSTVVPLIVDHPGSTLRVWVIGDSVASMRLLSTFQSTAPAQESVRARRLHRERELARAKITFDAVAVAAFATHPSRSPLFESAARLLTMPAKGEHIVIFLSDGRETALRDAECGIMPSPASWVKLLQSHGLFTAGYSGRLILAYADVTPVANNRCATSLDQYHRLIELWSSASKAAGVTFTNAPQGITLEQLTETTGKGTL